MSRPALGEHELRRYEFRVKLFRRRGMDADRADGLADRLATRDYDRDDRRMCIECAGLQRPPAPIDGRPAHSPRCGPMSRADRYRRPVEPVLDVLQRCHFFTFAKP